ncbi:hypothetical protein [Streptomyces xanthophaeus]|uniref:hypothetical protein n=1 Tax=Streptomyces xanthophaeus TaxID=67385 RepID=UPI00264A3A2D|nr:hypothetical protein [Streptomyces xanthophaeus]WKD30559.1 hypothetical protein KO717_00255 [Streptomyces xanthophaeus]
MNGQGRKVLRRKSFIAMSALFTTGIGVFAAGAGMSIAVDGPDSDALTVIAVCLGTIAFIRRITGSRIVLDEKVLSVVNPVFTHDIPYRYVARVAADSGGNLIITTSQATDIGAFGFAGSFIDHFAGSTDRTVAQIKAGLAQRDLRGNSRTVRRCTRAWVADGCTVGMLVFFALAGTIGDWAPAA